MCATCGCSPKNEDKVININLAAKKTGASTPAPKKDRIKGSKTNPKGSAASGKSKAIKFSDKVEKSLKNKVSEHNENAKEGRKATLGMLKAVYRRGAGAFSVSHRPGMTRDQWAMARVNAYLKLLKSGKPSNAAYKQDNDLLPASHPRSTKSSASALTASAHLVPEEQDLANALLEIVEKHGKFDQDGDGVWAGYTPPAENKVARIGVICKNCVFYYEDENGKDICQIIAVEIEDLGKCRFAVIPDDLISPDAIAEYKKEELKQDVDDMYYEQELSTTLKDLEEYESTEDAITALAEFSGLGYEVIPALRATWLRAVKDSEDPYSRVRNMAEYTYDSKDADLLPRFEKGSSS
jgi:rubredoxin